MYTERQIRAVTEERSVIIDEVNLAQNHISMRDHFGATIMAQVNFSDPIITVPSPGEEWIVERRNHDWFLKRRAGHSTLKTLDPGDTALSTTGRFYIGADEVIINDVTYLRAISGRIQSDGTVLGGSMFTCSKTGTGQYAITYKFPFDQLPAISASKLSTPSSNQGYVTYSGNATTGTVFQVWNSTGSAVDSNFTFIAMRII